MIVPKIHESPGAHFLERLLRRPRNEMSNGDIERTKETNSMAVVLTINKKELSCESEEILPESPRDTEGDKQKSKDADIPPSHKMINNSHNLDKKSLRKLTDSENDQPQSNLHVRYWTYLFDNLHRSIDEIFCACESEENISGCHVRKPFLIAKKSFSK